MMARLLRDVALILLHCLCLIVALAAIFLVTWDGVGPCFACFCNACPAWLNTTCDAWETWREDWTLDWWPLIYMGGLTAMILTVPWTFTVSTHAAEIFVHLVNLSWLILAVVPLTWGSSHRCGEFGKDFWMIYLGIATGRFCGINMCLLLLTVGRSSPWLWKFSTGYTEAISIHRVAGWWCVGHVVLHTISFVAAYYKSGGWDRVWYEILPLSGEPGGGPPQHHGGGPPRRHGPEMNTRGMLNFYGLLGTLAAIALAGFAFQRVRRRMYGTFYNVHLVTALIFIVLGAFHDFNVLLFTIPASAYLVDRLCALRASWHRHRAQLSILTPNVVALKVALGALPLEHLALGSRWLYIKVPSVSREWHPFSIVGPNDVTELHIKAIGDWSQALCSMAQECQEVDVQVDGPYGVVHEARQWGGDACPFSSRRSMESLPRLLLVAGGVGIVPFADLLRMGSAMRKHWSTATLIWVVRGMAEYEALERSLQVKSIADTMVHIQLFITGNSDEVSAFQDSPPPQPVASLHQSPDDFDSRSMNLRSSMVTAAIPALVLYFAIRAQSSLQEAFGGGEEEGGEGAGGGKWNAGVFTWSLATHGSVTVMSYGVVAIAAVVLAFCVFIAQSTYHVCARRFHISRRIATGARGLICQAASAEFPQRCTISSGRPNLSHVVLEQGGQSSLLEVRACGPRPLMDACRKAVSQASSQGHSVTLEIEQSEW